jgi:hypothetical protein
MRSQRKEPQSTEPKSRCMQRFPCQKLLPIQSVIIVYQAKGLGIGYWVLGIGKTFPQSLIPSPQSPIPRNLLQNVRELPSDGLICHPLFGTDPIRPVLLGRRPHQQIHLGRLSESRAKCDRRRITERNKRVQR